MIVQGSRGNPFRRLRIILPFQLAAAKRNWIILAFDPRNWIIAVFTISPDRASVARVVKQLMRNLIAPAVRPYPDALIIC